MSLLKSSYELIHEELNVVQRVLESRHRGRMYRHHIWYRDVQRCHRVIKRMLGQRQSFNADAILETLLKSGASVWSELRCNRIDTLPVALGLLAAVSRLYWLFFESEPMESLSVQTLKQRQFVTAEYCGTDTETVEVTHGLTIGGAIDVMQAREGGRQQTSGERKRPRH